MADEDRRRRENIFCKTDLLSPRLSSRTVRFMHRMLRHGIIVFGALLPVVVFAQSSASSSSAPFASVAISQQSGVEVRGDFQVGPTRYVLEMDPGETRTVEIQLTSREGEPRSYTVGVEDFSVTDDGTDNIQFYGNGYGPFSARSWIEPATTSIGLKHGERAFLPVRVTIPKNASVGDHYSVVLFERDPKGEVQGGFNLIARIGALLLITVKGDVVHKGGMDYFRVSKPLYWSLPTQFSIQYKNEGTVHVTPSGRIEVKNIFGIPVDDIPVKDWYVLRNSVRRRDIVWQPKFALGYYKATLTLNSAAQESEIQKTVSFWVVPALPVLLTLFIIFLVSFLVQAFFSHFEIKKKKEEASRR